MHEGAGQFSRRARDPARRESRRAAPPAPGPAGAPGQPGAVWARPRRQVLVGRRVAELRHQVEAAALGHQARGRRVRIGEVAEVARAGRARPHARRNAVLLGQIGVVDPVDAQRALLHHALIGIQLARAVRAGPGAQAAADAELLVDQHDAVLGALVRRAGRAHGDAGGVARSAGRTWGSGRCGRPRPRPPRSRAPGSARRRAARRRRGPDRSAAPGGRRCSIPCS